jgi:hypothetical protein
LRNKEFGIFPIADSPVENMWIAERGKFTDRPKGGGERRCKRIFAAANRLFSWA